MEGHVALGPVGDTRLPQRVEGRYRPRGLAASSVKLAWEVVQHAAYLAPSITFPSGLYPCISLVGDDDVGMTASWLNVNRFGCLTPYYRNGNVRLTFRSQRCPNVLCQPISRRRAKPASRDMTL